MNTHAFIVFLVPFSHRLHRNKLEFSPVFSLICLRTSWHGFSVQAREVKMPSKKASAKKTLEKSKKEIVWSDDESELLLNVTNDYKAAKGTECVDQDPLSPNIRTSLNSSWLLYHRKVQH